MELIIIISALATTAILAAFAFIAYIGSGSELPFKWWIESSYLGMLHYISWALLRYGLVIWIIFRCVAAFFWKYDNFR